MRDEREGKTVLDSQNALGQLQGFTEAFTRLMVGPNVDAWLQIDGFETGKANNWMLNQAYPGFPSKSTTWTRCELVTLRASLGRLLRFRFRQCGDPACSKILDGIEWDMREMFFGHLDVAISPNTATIEYLNDIVPHDGEFLYLITNQAIGRVILLAGGEEE